MPSRLETDARGLPDGFEERSALKEVSPCLLYVESRAAVARAERTARATPRRAISARGLVDELRQEVASHALATLRVSR